MNKEAGKKLWFTIIERELVSNDDGKFNLSTPIEKLKRMKFTYGGEMKKVRSTGGIDKWFEYALYHWGTLIKMFTNELAVLKAEEIVATIENVSDNQCGLCNRISKSSWAFIELTDSLKSRLLPKEVEKIKTNKASLICRARSLCRKKQQKQDRQRLHMGSLATLL